MSKSSKPINVIVQSHLGTTTNVELGKAWAGRMNMRLIKPESLYRWQAVPFGTIHLQQLDTNYVDEESAYESLGSALRKTLTVAKELRELITQTLVERAKDRIDSYVALAADWNCRGASEINTSAMTNARNLISRIPALKMNAPSYVAPSPVGAITISWLSLHVSPYALIECYNNGRARSLFSGLSGELEVEDVPTTEEGFDKFLIKMKQYLAVKGRD